MRGAPLVLALTGGGTAWMLHLLAGYFVVSLGCPRQWPALGVTLITVTGVCSVSALAVAALAWRERQRVREDGESSRLLLTVAVLLAALFAITIVLGGLAVAALPPCQAAVGGGP